MTEQFLLGYEWRALQDTCHEHSFRVEHIFHADGTWTQIQDADGENLLTWEHPNPTITHLDLRAINIRLAVEMENLPR